MSRSLTDPSDIFKVKKYQLQTSAVTPYIS